MRWPRWRSLVWPIALLLWVGGVAWYWWKFVPFAPAFAFRLNSDNQFVATTRTGEVAFHGERNGVAVAPIRLHDPFSGKLLRSLGEPDARLMKVSRFAGFAALVSNGKLEVFNVESGECVFDWPGVSGSDSVLLSDDGRYVGLFQFPQLTIWDLKEGSHEFLSVDMPPAGRRIPKALQQELARQTVGGGAHRIHGNELVGLPSRNIIQHKWWKLTTGGEERHFSEKDVVEVSPDGRLAIMDDSFGDEISICEFSGTQLGWSLPRQLRFQGLHFSHDGSSVFCFGDRVAPGEASRSRLVQWDAWRGPEDMRQASIDASVEDETNELFDGIVAGDGRRAVILRRAPSTRAPTFVTDIAKYFGSSWDGRFGPDRLWGELVAQPSGDILGRISAPAGQIGLLATGTGFLSFDRASNRVLAYTFFPSRDWIWLFGWALGPPAVVWCVRLQLAYRRRRGEGTGGLAATALPL